MKSQSATEIVTLFGLLFAGKMVITEAGRESITIEEGDINFDIYRYDDGRTKPYRVIFTQDSVESTYKFNTAGFVTNFFVGSERYKVQYESNGDLKRVKLTSSERRNLAAKELAEDALERGSTDKPEGSRRLYACEDCIEAWDGICDEGVPSVCELVNYGSPILAAAETSINTMCETLGAACSSSGGMETCAGQCEGDDDGGSDDDKVLNACLDSASDDYRCSYDGTTTYLDLNNCFFVDEDGDDLPSCFESFGKANIVTTGLSFQDDLTTLPVGVFSGLSALIDMDLSYTALKSLPDGVFSGLTEVTKLEIHYSQLASLPEGLFSDMTKLESLVVSSAQLTSLPAGVFLDLTSLERLDLSLNPDLQCVPLSSASDILLYPETIGQGTCECEPAEAITCETGYCQPGTEGYTCV